MNHEEQAYNAAGDALVDWIDTHKDTVEVPILATILLEKAIDGCLFCLGPDQTMKAVDAMMQEKIREYAKEPSNN